jgi:NAD(P)-dependent dehydrogenase (short-subunit alcohol dehydrogenase family)
MKNKKYLIIVGANGYLSQFFSKNLCKKYNLILWDIKFDKKFLMNIKKLAEKNNSYVVAMNVDNTNLIKIKNSIKIITSKKIKIYGLINCAGLNPQPNVKNPDFYKNYKSFINMWDKEINISLKGYMLMIYEVSKILQKSKSSTIINFSSDLGIISPNQNIYSNNSVKPLVYSVSKHGIIGMTKYFATLFSKKGIRVNSICFGGVYNREFDKKFINKLSKLVPMERMCNIEEIISPINFLLDDKNSYMTGHSLVIDGGRTIW